MIRKRLPLAILLAASFSAVAQPRDAQAILDEFGAVTMPQFDATRRQDEAYVRQYREDRKVVAGKMCELIWELYQADPTHAQVPELMARRWQMMAGELGKSTEVLEETQGVIDQGGALAAEAAYANSMTSMMRRTGTFEENLAKVERFIELAPADPRAVRLLMQIASTEGVEGTRQVEIYRRILSTYPGAPGTDYVAGKIRQVEEVGKPFELEFQEVTSGDTINIEDLRGKIIVLDFWATWCGPCVAEMPHMKELYAQFKDRGVEFIGVSLDQPEDKGGLAALQKYVKDNEVPWPQYYQGNYWQSEFSTSWGINSIPCLFVLDHEGRLVSVDARGQLEELIPELIAKRDGA